MSRAGPTSLPSPTNSGVARSDRGQSMKITKFEAWRQALILIVVPLVMAVAVSAWRTGDDAERLASTADRLPTDGTAVKKAATSGMRVTAWLPYWDGGAGTTALRDNASTLDSVHLFWYEARSATDIALQAKKTSTINKITQDAHMRVVATVTESLQTAPFRALLFDEGQRAAHVTALCSLAVDNHYDGIDLDYEKFSVGAVAADVADIAPAYSRFVGELAACLHGHHKSIEVTVMARYTDDPLSVDQSLASGMYDYRALGRVADVVRLMAYDFHYPGSGPGAVAPLPWVDDVLSYATQRIDKRKVDLGIPLYGYDWANGGHGKAVIASKAPELAASHGATIQMDPISRSKYFDYVVDGVDHIVWFDDTEASELRISLAMKHGIGGVAFWALGDEPATFWR